MNTNSILTSVSAFAALMAGISIATERVVEMIKGYVPFLANPWKQYDQVRGAILQLLAASAGAVIALQMSSQVQSAIPANWGPLHWQAYVVIGLISSGGSGAWNHVLDILGALKKQQESSVPQTVAGQTPASAAAAASS